MPLYAYKCWACQARRDVLKPIADLNRSESCEKCQATMERQLAAPAVIGDYAGYACPISNKWVEGRRAHEENLKKHGCRVYEGGETEAFRANKQKEETELDRRVDETVEQYYEALPAEGREQLAVAVQSGLDVAIERK